MTRHDPGQVPPFGHPRINAWLPTPRGLSQAPTSFFGSWCQGIHPVLLPNFTQHANNPPPPTPGERQQGCPQRLKMLASTVQFSNNNQAPRDTPAPHTHHHGERVYQPTEPRPGPDPPTACSLRTQQCARTTTNHPTPLSPPPTPKGSRPHPPQGARPHGGTHQTRQPATTLSVDVPPSSTHPVHHSPTEQQVMTGTADGPHQTTTTTPTHRRGQHSSDPEMLLRKEVIQPHLPVRLPCYDFVPIASPTFDSSPRKRLGHWLRVLPTFVT